MALMEELRPPRVALRGQNDSVEVVHGSSVLFVIPAAAVARSAVLEAIVQYQQHRSTSLDPAQLSDWLNFPDSVPSDHAQLLSLLEARSLLRSCLVVPERST